MLGSAAGKMAPQLRELAAFPGDFVQFQYLCLAELTTASSRDPWPSVDTHTRMHVDTHIDIWAVLAHFFSPGTCETEAS